MCKLLILGVNSHLLLHSLERHKHILLNLIKMCVDTVMQYTKDPLSWNSSFMGVTVTMEEIQSGVQSGASTLYTLAPECNILHFCPSHPFLCHYPPQFSGSYIYLFSNDPYMVLTLVIASYFVLSLALVLRLTCISCHCCPHPTSSLNLLISKIWKRVCRWERAPCLCWLGFPLGEVYKGILQYWKWFSQNGHSSQSPS